MNKKKYLGHTLDPQDQSFLQKAFQVNMLVRNVSGSACRSLFSGLVMTIGAELLLDATSPFSLWSGSHQKLFAKNDVAPIEEKLFLEKNDENHFLDHLTRFYRLSLTEEQNML